MPHRYYRFADGPVDLFALDSNWMDSDQRAWLEKGLICSDRCWQVAYLHHPIYSSGKHGSDRDLREVLEPVLVRGGRMFCWRGTSTTTSARLPRRASCTSSRAAAAKI